ncbi:Com family DNA-binding transcriptional regulator [Spongiibacter sp. UBA1325]|uniref:Com family DNA-binding transcriptional regulator n=1 Tax=Spongiibacter sp. UBA1325 TaxID=1947543 RepID=UPI0039C94AA9
MEVRVQEIRCSRCNRLLGKGQYVRIEIKCPRCKFFNNLSAPSTLSAKSAHKGAHHVHTTQP